MRGYFPAGYTLHTIFDDVVRLQSKNENQEKDIKELKERIEKLEKLLEENKCS